MRFSNVLLVCVMAAVLIGIGTPAVTAQEPEVKKPQPTVPEIFTIKGQFVRIAYNSEGWTTLGYRTANDSQGQDWLMVEVGLSLRKPTKNQTLTRDSFTLKMSDGSIVPMATQKEYNGAGYLRALNARANTVRDSINYFPVEANQACAVGFFSDPTKGARSISYDQFELSFRRACLGRLFFKLPEAPRLPRPPVLQAARGGEDRARPVLALRRFCRQPGANALQDHDQGGREVPQEKLEGPQEAA